LTSHPVYFDPQGIAWEQFHTLASIPVFSEAAPPQANASACCAEGMPRGKSVAIPVKAAGSCCGRRWRPTS
jgi:lactoylglutathione lyase